MDMGLAVTVIAGLNLVLLGWIKTDMLTIKKKQDEQCRLFAEVCATQRQHTSAQTQHETRIEYLERAVYRRLPVVNSE